MAKKETEFYLKLNRDELSAAYYAFFYYLKYRAPLGVKLKGEDRKNHDEMVANMKEIQVKIYKLRSMEAEDFGPIQ